MAFINPTLFVPDQIVSGLADGSLKRIGGVVRDLSGHIVSHLVDAAPRVTDFALGPLSGADMIVRTGTTLYNTYQLRTINTQLTNVLSSLNNVLIASNVAAFASVAGIGVTIASTAYLASRLNHISNQIADVQRTLSDMQVRQSQMFSFLADFAQAERQHFQILCNKLDRALIGNVLNSVTPLRGALKVQSLNSSTANNTDILRTSVEAEMNLKNYAQIVSPSEAEILLIGPIIASYWCFAIQTKCRSLIESGNLEAARNEVYGSSFEFRRTLESWSSTLLKHENKELETSLRFFNPLISTGVDGRKLVPSQAEERVVRMMKVDRSLYFGPDHEYLVPRNRDRITERKNRAILADPDPDRPKELVRFKVIDGFSELADRVDSCHHYCDALLTSPILIS